MCLDSPLVLHGLVSTLMHHSSIAPRLTVRWMANAACRDQLRSTRRSLGEGTFTDLLPKAETPFTFEALSKARGAQVSLVLHISVDAATFLPRCCLLLAPYRSWVCLI